ncbi:MAG: hypothetical protein AAF333_09725 [Planctomycetota bacterium]
MFRPTRIVCLAVVLCSGISAVAQDLFSITAVGNGVNTVTATDQDVLDLAESAIETTGAFSSLSGQTVVSTLNYGGVPNAAQITVNPAGTSATLTFPITGFSQTFVGTDPDDLADEIEEFLLEDGSDAYADFLRAIRERSVAAVLDGNPSATTARLARHTFDLYGLGVNGPSWANPNHFTYAADEYNSGNVGWFEVTPTYERIEAGDFDGDVAAINAAGGFYFSEYLGVSAGGSFAFNDLEGTDIFHSSFHVALNWAVVPLTDWDENPDDAWTNSVGWQLSPFVHSGVGASSDAAAGGGFFGVGLASNVHLGVHDKVIVNWGTQIVYAEGVDVEFEDFDDDDDFGDEDFEFDTDLSQGIVSTGVVVTTFLDRPDGNVFLDGGASYFFFIDDAAVDYWVSPEVGLGWRFGRDSRLRFTYRPIFGNADYEAHTAGLNLVFAF